MNCAVRCLAVAAIVAAHLGITAFAQNESRNTKPPKQQDMKVHPMGSIADRDPIEGELPSLVGATTWLNSQSLTPASLRGKVVLVQFWTYTCVNWRRTLPYVRAWADKYKSQGLVVLGVHTPEFAFEKNIDNIRWATKDMRVTRLQCARENQPEPVGALRWLGGKSRGCGFEADERTHHLSLPCARPESRHGTGDPRQECAISCAHRWKAARPCAWNRYRRPGLRHGF